MGGQGQRRDKLVKGARLDVLKADMHGGDAGMVKNQRQVPTPIPVQSGPMLKRGEAFGASQLPGRGSGAWRLCWKPSTVAGFYPGDSQLWKT